VTGSCDRQQPWAFVDINTWQHLGGSRVGPWSLNAAGEQVGFPEAFSEQVFHLRGGGLLLLGEIKSMVYCWITISPEYCVE